jgi:hypothetical protein
MGTNCAPILDNLFLYSYKAEYMHGLHKEKRHEVTPVLYRHVPLYTPVYDVIKINNSKFDDYFDHIYPTELEIKDTTNTVTFYSHLDLHCTTRN